MNDGQENKGSVLVSKDISQSVQRFSPSFDHFENSGFSLELDTTVLLLLLLLETEETLDDNISYG